MNYIGKFITNFKEFYNEINSATLTGAIDVIVIKQADQTYLCSPFHVRFGKMGVLRSKEKIVDIEINGEPVDIHMKLGDNGEAFFVEELQDEEDRYNLPGHLATSPIPEMNLNMLASEIHRLKNKQLKAWSEQEQQQQMSTIITSDEVRSEYTSVPTLEQVLVEVPQRDNEQLISIASNGISSNDEKMKKMDSNKRRRRRRQNNSRTNTPASKQNDTSSLDVLDGSNFDEFSLYDDEFSRKSDDDEDNDDERGSLEEELADLNDALVRSNSLPIPGSFSVSQSMLGISTPGSIPPPPPPTLKNLPSEIYPFSDGEMSPFHGGSPKKQFERPSSPKSDTEYEISKTESSLNQTGDISAAEVSWQWGELPQVSRKISTNSHRSSNLSLSRMDEESKGNGGRSPNHINQNLDRIPIVESKSGVFQNVFTLLKKEENKRTDKNLPSEEGIYLDDLNPEQLDPKVAELYFPKLRSSMPLKRISDDETESGNGPSLPHSPHSGQDEVESRMEDRLEQAFDEKHGECFDKDTQTSCQMSPEIISARLSDNDNEVPEIKVENPLRALFSKCEMSLCAIGTTPNEFDWQAIDHQKFDQNRVSYENFIQNPMEVLKNPALVCRIDDKCYNWQVASCMLVSSFAYGKSLPDSCVEALMDQHMQSKKKETVNRSSWWSWRRSYVDPLQIKPEIANAVSSADSSKKNDSTIDDGGVNDNRRDRDSSETDTETDQRDDYDYDDNSQTSKTGKKFRKFHYRKVLRLTSKDIEGLNLQEGANEAVFSVTTAYQGTTRCKCHLYLWNHDDKIIISDIDGTITKSDVLGHILPILGKDWAQSGVANLFTKIKENGYKLLYLSARAIGQAKITREYLKSVRQGDLCLPDGPLLLSPTSLISAFHREVIEKKPEEFKISCLKDIQALFPQNPFYAGFGNKINDTWAYRAVDIPLSRIFTINHRGELKLELIQTFQSSYTRLSDVVDQMFPPLEAKSQNDFLSEYSTFNYWRDMLPEIAEEQKSDAKMKEESSISAQPNA